MGAALPFASCARLSRSSRAALLALAFACGCTTLAGDARFEDGGDARAPDAVADVADVGSAPRCPAGFDASTGGRETVRVVTGTRTPALERFVLVGAMLDGAGGVYVYGFVRGCSSPDTYDAAVVRLTSDAEVDPTFGEGGRVCVAPAGTGNPMTATAFFAAMARDPRGRLVLAGESRWGPAPWGLVVRLDADGGRDETFGPGGARIFPLSATPGLTSLSFHDLAAEADGVVVVGAESNSFAPSGYSVVMRLRDDGTRDEAFHDGAWVDGTSRGFRAIAAVPGGFAVAGTTRFGAHALVARLDRAGRLVDAFGRHGVATHTGHDSFTVTALVADDRGGFIVGGSTVEPSPGDTAWRLTLQRFDADGAPDEGFGAGGTLRTPQSWDPGYMRRHAMTSRCDGQLLIVTADDGDLSLLRMLPRGAFDGTFAMRGLLPLGRGSVRTVLVDPATEEVTVVGILVDNAGPLGDLPSLWRVVAP